MVGGGDREWVCDRVCEVSWDWVTELGWDCVTELGWDWVTELGWDLVTEQGWYWAMAPGREWVTVSGSAWVLALGCDCAPEQSLDLSCVHILELTSLSVTSHPALFHKTKPTQRSPSSSTFYCL